MRQMKPEEDWSFVITKCGSLFSIPALHQGIVVLPVVH